MNRKLFLAYNDLDESLILAGASFYAFSSAIKNLGWLARIRLWFSK